MSLATRQFPGRHTWSGSIALTLALLLGAPSASGDVYKYVDRDGVVHLADRKLHAGYRLIVRSKRGARAATLTYDARNRQRYGPLVDKAAELLRLDKALVHAVVSAESAYDPRAVSRAGAVGLMQLMPATAERYGVHDRFNPAQNVFGGARYLRDLLERFDSLSVALAAYNAGESAVEKHGNRIPPYPETREYVRRVLDFYQRYRQAS